MCGNFLNVLRTSKTERCYRVCVCVFIYIYICVCVCIYIYMCVCVCVLMSLQIVEISKSFNNVYVL